jgi:hypothetical protein
VRRGPGQGKCESRLARSPLFAPRDAPLNSRIFLVDLTSIFFTQLAQTLTDPRATMLLLSPTAGAGTDKPNPQRKDYLCTRSETSQMSGPDKPGIGNPPKRISERPPSVRVSPVTQDPNKQNQRTITPPLGVPVIGNPASRPRTPTPAYPNPIIGATGLEPGFDSVTMEAATRADITREDLTRDAITRAELNEEGATQESEFATEVGTRARTPLPPYPAPRVYYKDELETPHDPVRLGKVELPGNALPRVDLDRPAAQRFMDMGPVIEDTKFRDEEKRTRKTGIALAVVAAVLGVIGLIKVLAGSWENARNEPNREQDPATMTKQASKPSVPERLEQLAHAEMAAARAPEEGSSAQERSLAEERSSAEIAKTDAEAIEAKPPVKSTKQSRSSSRAALRSSSRSKAARVEPTLPKTTANPSAEKQRDHETETQAIMRDVRF